MNELLNTILSILEDSDTQDFKETSQTSDYDKLIKMATQYEAQAKAIRNEAEKIKQAKKTLHFESNIRQIPCCKYHGEVKRFAQEKDLQLYLKFLQENGANPNEIDVFNIDIELSPRFWRS